eukprot:9073716-Ditylum_brightwellii.AAC.1
MARLDNQKEQLSTVTITSQQNTASIDFLSLIIDTNKKEILQRCNNIIDEYNSMSSQLFPITSSNKKSINNMSEKIIADKVEILDCYNAMNDTSEKMEARINILKKSDKDLTKNIDGALYSDKLASKVEKIKTNQSDIQYNVDHLNKI